jgi:SAM-dependent methyltransferase
MANTDRDWNARYQSGDLPWDSGLASRELRRVLDEEQIALCRALELGCGTGTNAVELARRGFDVTGVDCAPRALEIAREKAAAAGVRVQWIAADVQNFGDGLAPFDFIFDRGCYHCCRRVDLAGYQATLRQVTRHGTRMLCLAGHIDEASEHGIPRVSAQDLEREFGPLFNFEFRRPFHFQDAGGSEGPLGWSVLMRRSKGAVEQRSRGAS